MIRSQRLAEPVAEPEAEVSKIEGRIVLMNGAMMVGTHKNHVLEFVLPAARQPLDVMAVTGSMAVSFLGVVKADLASAIIELLQRLYVLASATNVGGLE